MNRKMKQLEWLALAVAALVFAVGYVGALPLLHDGMFVAAQFGRNLAEGNGLVFNADGSGPACSDLFGALLAAAVSRLGGDPLSALRADAAVGALAFFAATAWLGRTVAPTGGWAAVLLVLPLAAVGYAAAVPGDGLWLGALLAVGVAAELRGGPHGPSRLGALAFAVVALQRPSLVLVFVTARLVRRLLDDVPERDRKSPTIDLAAVTAIAAAALLWRWGRFGTPLVGELGGSEAMVASLRDAATRYPSFGLSLALPLAVAISGRRHHGLSAGRLYGLFAIAFVALVMLSSGGSGSVPYQPALTAALPLFAVLLAALPPLLFPRQVVGATLSFALLVTAGQALVVDDGDEWANAIAADERVARAQRIAAWVASQPDAAGPIACDLPGTTAYHSRRKVIGLSQPGPLRPGSVGFPMPRSPAEAALQQQPRLIFFTHAFDSFLPDTPSEVTLADQLLFRFFYASETAAAASVGGDEAGEIHYFEFRSGDAALWHQGWEARDDDDKFIESAIAAAIANTPVTPPEVNLQAQVERLAQEANDLVESGQVEEAAGIFERVRSLNQRARVATAARRTSFAAAQGSDLHRAVADMRDAVRFDPENSLTRRDLRIQLRVPINDFYGPAIASQRER